MAVLKWAIILKFQHRQRQGIQRRKKRNQWEVGINDEKRSSENETVSNKIDEEEIHAAQVHKGKTISSAQVSIPFTDAQVPVAFAPCLELLFNLDGTGLSFVLLTSNDTQ